MMKKLAILLFILMMAVPVFAQETTETPIIPEVTIVNELPSPVEEEVNSWATIGKAAVILTGVLALGLAFISWRNSNPNASIEETDEKLSELVRARRQDREWMEKLERGYQDMLEHNKNIIDSLAETIRYISTITPIKTDDELADLIEDIQSPGSNLPEEPAPTEPPVQ